MTQRAIAYLVIPPEQDAEFVAAMEAVLEVYARPYEAAHPVLCMDEQPVQLIKETHTPRPGTRKQPPRSILNTSAPVTASLFLFTEPLGG